MAETSYQHISLETVDGVLVVTLNEAQLRGDKMADALREELLAIVGNKSGQRVVISFQKVCEIMVTTFITIEAPNCTQIADLHNKLLKSGASSSCQLSRPSF